MSGFFEDALDERTPLEAELIAANLRLEAELASLRERGDAAFRGQAVIQQTLTECRTKVLEMAEALKDYRIGVARLREENRDLWQKRNDLVQEVGDLRAELASLSEDHRDLEMENQGLKEERARLREELRLTQEELMQTQEREDRLRADRDAHWKAAIDAKNENEVLREENDDLKNQSWENDRVLRENARLRDITYQVTDLKNENARLREVEKAARHVAKVAANGAYLSQKDWLRLVDALNPPPEQISRNALKETT